MVYLFNLLFLFVSGVSVCIDPGHGGTSIGAVGEYALEKDVVLDIAFLLQNWLCQVPGVSRAALTRDGDYDVSLQARTDYANTNGFDYFVSIHENAYNGSVQGTETFCGSLDPDDQSFQMAMLVQDRILDAYGYTDRGVKDGGYLHVIRETFMPAVLGEGSFLDYELNWNESYLYAFNVDDHSGIQAWGYADALCSFWGLPSPAYGNGIVLMDNLSSGFSLGDSLLWQMDTSGAPWMGSCLLAQGGSSAFAQWSSLFPVSGSFTLESWWTSGGNRSSSVCYRVSHSGGITDVFLDQTAGGGEWVSAGSFSFSGQFVIQLLCSGSAPGTVVADAVRLVPPLGIEGGSLSEMTVVQNPSSSFTMVFADELYRTVTVFDLSGRTVDTLGGSGSLRWTPANDAAGVYFAVDETSGESVKLLLIR